MTVKILAFCGSSRRESFNQKLLEIAAAGATANGAEVSFISLADYPLPIYDADAEREQGVPEKVRALQDLFATHHALLVASPEHNGGYTAALKNMVDWVSRPTADGTPGVALFTGKVAAVISASPGPMGGIRAMLGMRGVLEKLGAIVIPQGFSLGSAHQAFAGSGSLADEKADAEVRRVGLGLVNVTKQLIAR
ncbi:NADPH-dependent FMN reductase [Burkholderia cenocepacia]|uniref:NADPH-dependent FMN reductase n=1 Tax=Burkholderia cenocepacia TaxID=95486 RepID=UPI002AB62A8E|nr:NAD(P)H-dependent oxidoreductase [Burkholderia cenocepacia]